MLILWDEAITGLHFLLQGGAITNAALTENAQVATSQDGITNLIAASRPEYCDEITLEVPPAEADESCFLTPNTYYLANWLSWCYTSNRAIRVFQCDEDFGACRAFRCAVRAIPKEVAPFADFGNTVASAKIALGVFDGPKLPMDMPESLSWDLYVVEDGTWSPSLNTLGGTIPSTPILTLTARTVLNDNELTGGNYPAVDLSYEQLDPAAPNQPLTITALTHDDDASLRNTEVKISVSLATGAGPGNALTTTAAELKAALLADAEVMSLISVAAFAGHDAEIVTAFAKAWITGWSEEDNALNNLWDRSA
jgi:hypothetical protein